MTAVNGAAQERPNRKHAFEQQLTKPTPLPVKPAGIPTSIKERAQWVVWKYTWDADKTKWTKPPYQANRPQAKASSTNPRTWATFNEAMAAYQTGECDGVGYVLNGNEVGIDLDNVRDPANGTIEPWAIAIAKAIASYSEVSPSGTGIKIIAKGALRAGRKFTHIDAEMYSRERYFALTGHITGEHSVIEDRQAELDALLKMLEDRNETAKEGKAKSTSSWNFKASRGPSASLTDEELIAKASAAERRAGKKFRDFMNGDISGYPSASEADLAFCNLIVFYTDDPEQVLRIVQKSGMDRDKWSRADYAERTIKTAFEGRRTRYDPNYRSNGQSHHEHNGHARGGEDNGHVAADVCLTDVGNGKRYVADHGAIVRYCHPWKKWLIWDGMRWRIDNTGRVMALAKRTILGLFRWAEKQIRSLAEDESPEAGADLARIKAVLGFARRSQHVQRLHAMLELAKSEPGIPILPEQLDSHIWLFNCPNGTVDLKTGKLRAHDQKDYLTKLCPINYVPSAQCPIWKSTVNSIFANDVGVIECVRRFGGYSLTGDTREQELPIAIGKGANGKTLILRTILNVMGADYAGIVPSELLVETKGNQHPTIKAKLFGMRLMIAFETAQDDRLNEARIKTLTGEDGLTGRRMREDFWDFIATHKIILCTNHLPKIRDQDHSTWRRLAVWPFTQTYWDSDKGETGPPQLKADKTLKVKLQAEFEGILAWLVQGCLDWQQHGIIRPDSVRNATNHYKSTQDKLSIFIAERCVTGPQMRVKASTLWGAFQVWAKGNREQPVTSTAFGNAMREGGFEKDDGKRWYLGIDLLSPDSTENESEGPRS